MVDRTRRGGAKRGVFARMMTAFCAGAMGVAALAGTPASAANLLQKNFWLSGPDYSGDVPACDHFEVLNLIGMRFEETERMYWNSHLQISLFEKVQEIAFRPWGPEYQPRRYCRGTVTTSDAHKRAIYYSVIEDGGLIGASWGVEWCIVGLDRNYAYAPSCKMAGP